MAPSRRNRNNKLTVPDPDEIRSFCGSGLFKKGEESYKNGNVMTAYIDGDEIEATVYDDEDNEEYNVDIDMEFGYHMYARCTCEMSSTHGVMCKHVVAVLLHLNNGYDDIDLYDDVTEEAVSDLLEKIPPEEAKAFFAKMIADNKAMLHRFITEKGLRSEYSISKHAGNMIAQYNNADKIDGKIKEYLDFSEQFDKARKTRQDNQHEEAIRMYKAISEAISDRMDIVEDHSGYYADCFIESLEGMVECILRKRMQHEEKKTYISYLFEKATAPNNARFARYYRDALESICNTNDDLNMWHGLVSIPQEKKDGTNKDEIAEMLQMKYHISKQFDQYSEVIHLLAKHHTMYSNICILYLKALRHIQQQQQQQSETTPSTNKRNENNNSDNKNHTTKDNTYAFPDDSKVLEAAYAFPDDSKVLEAAYVVLPENSKGRAKILERLYAITGEWDHIIRLKHILPDWNDVKNEIVENISDISPKNAVTLCVKEDMYDDGMDILESTSDMETLVHFKSKMIRKKLQRYATCYAKTLLKFAGSKSNKEHYKRVKNYLDILKEMPKCEKQYKSSIASIRKKYSSRRVLIKELSDM